MGERVYAGPDGETKDAAKDPVPVRAGMAAVDALFGNGIPEPRAVADVMLRYPQEIGPIVEFLQRCLGNTYAIKVLDEWGKASQKPPAGVVKDGAADDTDAPPTATDMAGSASTAEDKYTELLARQHAGTRGETGTAAWLLAAMDDGLVTIDDSHADTKTQLEQFVADRDTITSNEKMPGKKDRRADYEVEVESAPILETLVGLLERRVQAWRTKGSKGKPKPLAIQNLIRADPGYGGGPHTRGMAMDLGHSNSDMKGFMQTLDELPPGAARSVFPDGSGSLHVGHHSDKSHKAGADGFDLGFPPSFFDLPVAASEEGLKVFQHKAEHAADASDTELEVKALAWGSVHVHVMKATKTADGAWTWTDKTHGEAKSHLKDKKLRAKLEGLAKKED
jgi:hypothetical protein